MRIKSKISISVLLILLLIAMTLSGCQSQQQVSDPTQKTETTEKPNETQGTEEEDSLETDDRYGKYEEPITLSVLQTDPKSDAVQYDSSNPDRKSPTENAWINAYMEYLNIDVDRIIAEDATALNATINTSMASGDLPDVMIVSKSLFYTLVENGVCADLKDAYDSYTSKYGRLLAEAVDTYPNVLSYGTIDGELLGMPFFGNMYTNSDVLWVRQDWLDAVGMEPPSTIDQLIETARAFKKAKFNNKDVIGIGFTGIEDGFMAAYGVVMNTWYQQSDGTYIYSNTRDEMKDGLLALQGMYKEGLIKSDFAVTNILNEEIANGIVGMYYGPAWHAVVPIQANLNNDENAVWTAVRIPSLDGGDVKQWTDNVISSYIVVNKDCKNPEAIFKMIELELKMYYEPTPEESLKYYYCEDGYQIWNFRVFRNFIRADQDHLKAQQIIDALDKNMTADEINLLSKASYEKVLSGLNGNRADYGFYLGFVVGHPVIIEQREKGMLHGSYNGPITENISLYEQTINEAFTNSMLEIIMGADISLFDKAVDTWYNTGGQAITDDVNAYYKSMN